MTKLFTCLSFSTPQSCCRCSAASPVMRISAWHKFLTAKPTHTEAHGLYMVPTMTHECEIIFPYFLLYECLKHICTQLYSHQEGLSIEHNSTSTVSKKHLYLVKLNSWYKQDIPENMFPANWMSHCWQLRSSETGDPVRTASVVDNRPAAGLTTASEDNTSCPCWLQKNSWIPITCQ